MKRNVPVLLSLLAAVALLGALLAGDPRAETGFLLGGIQVNEPDHERWLGALAERGMNAVALTVYAHQGDWDSWNLWYDATDEGVLAELRAAERLGLDTVLVLRVALDHAFARNAFLWHGMIQPRSEADVEEWFRRYGDFVSQWAQIAEREGVDLLAVGSELNSLASTRLIAELPALEEWYLNPSKQEEHREKLLRGEADLAGSPLNDPVRGRFDSLPAYVDERAAAHRAWAAQVTWDAEPQRIERMNERRRLLDRHWRAVIAAARAVYSGPLTFAANFDQYRDAAFWDDLDLLGINAYFPLRETWRPVAGAEELWPDLAAGWRRRLGEIDAFRRSLGRPTMRLVFTELGYTARANATIEPWAQDGVSVVRAPSEPRGEKTIAWADQPLDPLERALAVRALREASAAIEPPLVAGILYWKLSTQPEHAAIEPFVLVLDESVDDPMLAELAEFRRRR